jgi:hypothetical protein
MGRRVAIARDDWPELVRRKKPRIMSESPRTRKGGFGLRAAVHCERPLAIDAKSESHDIVSNRPEKWPETDVASLIDCADDTPPIAERLPTTP